MSTQKPKTVLVHQPSAAPTRKMVTFAITAIVTAAVMQFTRDLAASHEYFAWLTDPAAQQNVPIVVGFVVAYWFRERGVPPPEE